MELPPFLEQDRFATAVGIELLHAEPGSARARLRLGDVHRNSVALIHGGAIFTLAASAFFAAVNARGETAVGISLSINFLNPVDGGTLIAEAAEVARSRKLSTCDVRVMKAEGDGIEGDGARGELVAMLRGTAYIKSARL